MIQVNTLSKRHHYIEDLVSSLILYCQHNSTLMIMHTIKASVLTTLESCAVYFNNLDIVSITVLKTLTS